MKKTTDRGVGTSFYGEMIHSTLVEMRKVLGDEDYGFVSGDGKVQYEWIREMDNGDIVTFYDYKHFRPIMDNEMVSWHIGGYNKESCMLARYEIEMLMYKNR